MSEVVKRIKEFIDFKKINTRRFEESIGFSNGAFASQYKHNRSIGVDKVEKILKVYTDLNPVWLLTGKESMLLSTTYEEGGSDQIRVLSESESLYKKEDIYKDKYIDILEKENEMLKEDLKQKQEIIQGFLSGDIQKTNKK